uniref:Putative secreted protein n=1 Tax=Anopheles darlingi TaxID=43151 RepID=A0A2M4DRE8_ANODA
MFMLHCISPHLMALYACVYRSHVAYAHPIPIAPLPPSPQHLYVHPCTCSGYRECARNNSACQRTAAATQPKCTKITPREGRLCNGGSWIFSR